MSCPHCSPHPYRSPGRVDDEPTPLSPRRDLFPLAVGVFIACWTLIGFGILVGAYTSRPAIKAFHRAAVGLQEERFRVRAAAERCAL